MNMQASKQRWGSGVQLPRLERGLEPEGSLCWLASSHRHPFIFPHAMRQVRESRDEGVGARRGGVMKAFLVPFLTSLNHVLV